jgi:hypothetical protein
MYSQHPYDDRPSTQPLTMELTGHTPVGWVSRIPPRWVGMSGYLIAGLFLGLIGILAVGFARTTGNDVGAASAGQSPGLVADNIVRLHSADVGASCWNGITKGGPARVTVSLEVGIDGKVRYAAASGESPMMRECVEAHVRGWEFLPQATAQTMVLPFEVDRR